MFIALAFRWSKIAFGKSDLSNDSRRYVFWWFEAIEYKNTVEYYINTI